MSAASLKDLLEQAAERSGAGTQIFAARVVEAANKELRRILGDDAGRFVRAKALRRGTLVAEIASPAAGLAVRRHEERLLEALRTAFPRARFDRIELQTPR